MVEPVVLIRAILRAMLIHGRRNTTIMAAGLVLLGFAAARCGGRAVGDARRAGTAGTAGTSTAGPAGTSGAANTSVDDQFDDQFDAYEQYYPKCQSLCAEHRPTSAAPFVCTLPTVAECVERCRVVLDNVDEPCAACLFDNFEWKEPVTQCSSTECVSDCGGVRFPSLDGAVCQTACEASVAYQRRLRENAPQPSPIGRLPTRILELPDVRLQQWVPTSNPNEFIAVAEGYPANSDSMYVGDVVGLWDENGNLRWSLAVLFPYPSGCKVLRLPDNRIALRTEYSGTNGVFVLSETGEVLSSRAAAQTTLWPDDGGDLLLLGSTSIERISPSLEPLGTWALSVAPDALLGFGTAFIFSRYQQLTRINREQDPPTTAHEYPMSGQIYRLKAVPGTGVVVAGYKKVAHPSKADELIWIPEAFLYGNDGAVLASFLSTQPVGVNLDVLVTPDNTVIVVGTEDPVSLGAGAHRFYTPSRHDVDEYAGRCSVYGCDGLTVREWTLDGTLLWEYQHRSVASRGVSALLRPDGSLRVLAHLSRETTYTAVFDFER